MSLPDGLADLDNKRSRRTRTVPPPRHGKRESQAAVPPAEEESAASPPAESPQEVPVQVVEPQLPASRRSTKAASSPPAPGEEPIRLVQVYLPQSADDYLRQVRAESLTRRKDVTASAAVRYAMEELIRTKTPAELVELLADRPTTGRKGRRR